MRRLVGLLPVALLLVAATAAPVKVRTVPLAWMVEHSDLIVVADVVAVRDGLLGPRLATAAPSEFWKGNLDGAIEFVASPSWTCDVATAIKGERVVLFLVEEEPGLYGIAHSGRGRLPFVEVDAESFASIFGDITFPDGAVTRRGNPKTGRSFNGIPVHELERLVDAAREEQRRAASDAQCTAAEEQPPASDAQPLPSEPTLLPSDAQPLRSEPAESPRDVQRPAGERAGPAH